MAKKNLKKQVSSTIKNATYAILVPDLGTITEAELAQIKSSNATHVFVLNNFNADSTSDKFIDFSNSTNQDINTAIQELSFDNVLHWGNAKCGSHAIDCAKSKNKNIQFIGEKPNKSKERKGQLSRVLYELTAQVSTNINAYGSHTKTAVYSKDIFQDLLIKTVNHRPFHHRRHFCFPYLQTHH